MLCLPSVQLQKLFNQFFEQLQCATVSPVSHANMSRRFSFAGRARLWFRKTLLRIENYL